MFMYNSQDSSTNPGVRSTRPFPAVVPEGTQALPIVLARVATLLGVLVGWDGGEVSADRVRVGVRGAGLGPEAAPGLAAALAGTFFFFFFFFFEDRR
jgi:hypothetical protein